MKKYFVVIALLLIPSLCIAADYSSNVSKLPETGQIVSDIGDALVQKRVDWDSDGKILYKGIAAAGDLSNSGTWRVFKYSYDDTDYTSNPSLIQSSEGAWTDRATLTYK